MAITDKLLALQKNLADQARVQEEMDDVTWIKTYYHLVDKETSRIVLMGDVINEEQEEFYRRILIAEMLGKIPMFFILKARQLGISTGTQGMLFCRANRRPNYRCGTVSHKSESSEHLFGMSRLAYDELPSDMRIPLEYNTKGVLQFAAPHRSRIVVGTAEDQQLFSSYTINAFHGSELAKWRNPRKPYNASMQCIPMAPSSLVVFEFTADGAGNLAYDLWQEACDEESGSAYEPIFFSFKNHKKYQIPLEREERLTLTPEEDLYQKRWHLTDAQMKWVLFVKKNKCNNDWNLFNQEYPIDPLVAFSASSSSYFDQEVLRGWLNRHTGTAQAPVFRGDLIWGAEEGPTLKPIREPDGAIEIWEMPETGSYYVIGGDISEGVHQDWSVLQVWKAPNIPGQKPVQVAKYRSNATTPDYVGLAAFKLGLFFNNALVGIEYNGPGGGSLQILERGWPGDPAYDENARGTNRGYTNLYYYTPDDRRSPEEADRLGWRTNKTTKRVMLGMLKSRIADNAIVLRSVETLKELMGFCYDPEKKDYVQTYENEITRKGHDDEVMSCAVAEQMIRHYLRGRFFRRIESWEDEVASGF